MDIGEVSERSGVPPSALRYYEEIGLIESIGRRGLRRQFGPDVILKLSLISLGQSAGFSLAEIAGMFYPNGEIDVPRDKLRGRVDQLDQQIEDLTTLRNLLRHVADCPEPRHLECRRFRSLLRAVQRQKPVNPRPSAIPSRNKR